MRREPRAGLAMAARQQDLSRHSAVPPTAHILAEGDRTAGLTIRIYAPRPHFLTSLLGRPLKSDQKRCGFVLPRALKNCTRFASLS